MRFYLGTHMPSWLYRPGVPVFVSHRRLATRKSFKRAARPWALDSGGFTELSMYRGWRTTPDEYITAVRRYAEQIGSLEWAAPQDWMCEPHILKLTGKTVREHQENTVTNFARLTASAPEIKFAPVLQGWELADYVACGDMYAAAGFDLSTFDTVGVGSVCRRQGTDEIGEIFETLAGHNLKLHGFGVKSAGLRRYGKHLESADSLAWSFRGRHVRPCPHTGVASCANCEPHALEWRERALRAT